MQAVPFELDARDDAAAPRVLLVDDDAINAHVVARVLKRNGCEVVVASSVRAARSWLERSQFDVVVTDIWVSDGTGIDVFHAARACDASASLVFLGGDPALPKLLASPGGSVRYLCKPLDPVALIDTVVLACREHRHRDE